MRWFRWLFLGRFGGTEPSGVITATLRNTLTVSKEDALLFVGIEDATLVVGKNSGSRKLQ